MAHRATLAALGTILNSQTLPGLFSSGDGKATHDFGAPNANLSGLAIDGSGRPVVAGYTSP